MGLSQARISGPWSRAEVAAHLDTALVPLRLAAVAPSGWPVVLSLWFARRGDELLCATQQSAAIVRALASEPRCAFEVAGEQPPYFGVRGRARVSIEPDGDLDVLRLLVGRYLGGEEGSFQRWLLGRPTPEVVLRLDPVAISSWDYRARMGETAAGAA